MLLSFKVKNYLSFKDEAGFSLEANKKIKTLPENKNIIKLKDGENIWLNKTAVFYGANASGKTNILKGLEFLKYITLNSFKFGIEEGINHELLKTFLLDESNLNKPIEFEIEFLIEKVKYRYFLKLNDKQIFEEKLIFFKKSRENLIFDYNRINKEKSSLSSKGYTEDYFGEDITNLVPRYNQTFISILANRDGEGKYLATKVIKFFKLINFINSKADLTLFTIPMLETDENKRIILSFINNADINIEDIQQEEREFKESDNIGGVIEINGKRIIPNKIVETNFIHPIFKNEQKVGNTGFNLITQESQGTQRLFGLLGPILNTIKSNGILLIDEVDTHMHFLLIENLIKFIHSLNDEGKNNIGNSQFIFNTHSLDLMDLELFRKDQIYFTSKNNYGATEIYSLDDFKEIQIRNNSDIKKAYKNGVFGGVPILSDFYL